MRRMRGFAALTATTLAVAVLYWQGCGSSGGEDVVTFRGNVESVVAAAFAPSSSHTYLARLGGWLFPSAVAQSSCSTEVEDVLACAGTGSEDEEGGQVRCNRVRTSDCGFQVEIRLAAEGDPVTLFFVQDENGDGAIDEGEPTASIDDPPTFPVCNGDVIALDDVEIDFEAGSYSADGIVKEEGCSATPTPTSTSGPSPTPTTESSPTPTTEPTPTATVTP